MQADDVCCEEFISVFLCGKRLLVDSWNAIFEINLCNYRVHELLKTKFVVGVIM